MDKDKKAEEVSTVGPVFELFMLAASLNALRLRSVLPEGWVTTVSSGSQPVADQACEGFQCK